jgi:hypothetical protein
MKFQVLTATSMKMAVSQKTAILNINIPLLSIIIL